MRFVPLLLLSFLAACASSPEGFVAVERPADDAPADQGWDATPPPMGSGAELRVRIDCGFLVGTPEVTLVQEGGRWVPGGDELPPRGPEELAECVPEGADSGWMDWQDDGTWIIEIGGVWHELAPSPTEDRWIGEAGLVFEPNAACEAGLAALGLTNPLTMAMEIVELVVPDAT